MKILIVGHGEYGSGIKSTIKLLTGVDEGIDAINLNEELAHERFTEIVNSYVKEHEKLIIFADITGGAPFQITSREVLLNEGSEDQYVIGGVSVGCILDIVMKTLVIESDEDIKAVIDSSLEGLKDMATVMCRKDIA
ncbi:PTS mannose transporter subunit IID [Clostridium sp. Ade.TY]|uniref:PTS sugar transporter subunit IIA n=1 Tax=Clostridium sp. Ade.TY TaxID=1391647 RepID=UPI000410D42A|nr:PTS mannose transporter subunit IID [Clostridium sp. Ade.TY]